MLQSLLREESIALLLGSSVGGRTGNVKLGPHTWRELPVCGRGACITYAEGLHLKEKTKLIFGPGYVEVGCMLQQMQLLSKTGFWGSHCKWQQQWLKKLDETGRGNSHFIQKQDLKISLTMLLPLGILPFSWSRMKQWQQPQVLQGYAPYQTGNLQVSYAHGNLVKLSWCPDFEVFKKKKKNTLWQ